MINNIKLEICISNIDDAIALENYDVDRIELVSAIELGGLTPSNETLKTIKSKVKLPVCAMVRCRGGNYIYTSLEKEVMLKDAKNLLDAGADGIVFGFLNEDSSIDIETTKKMVELIHSYNKEAVFHRAIDVPENLEDSIKKMINLKVDRILTSGQAPFEDILKGANDIKELNDLYGKDIQILFGGGVRVNNIKEIIKLSNVNQIHGTSKKDLNDSYGLDQEQLKSFIKELYTIN